MKKLKILTLICLSSNIKINIIRLFINHRPFKEVEIEKLEQSFNNIKEYLQKEIKDGKKINRDAFFTLLKEYGEEMTDKEIADCLQALKGDNNVKNLEENLSFENVFNDILRFEEIDKK